MKNLIILCLVFITVSLSSCEVIGGIFKAGVWVGVLAVVVVVGLIFYLFTRGKK